MAKQDSIGGIWKKTINTKNGPAEILSITIGDKRYTAWPNTYKQEGDKTPDYRIQEDTWKPKAEQVALPVEPKSFAGDLPF